jgi:hypothetical protein
MKPATATGKRKRVAHGISGKPETALTAELVAAQELWLGSPPRQIGEFEIKTWDCEKTAGEAVRVAKPEKKQSVFHQNFAEWQDDLCASAARYYNVCLMILLRNKSDPRADSPVDFARAITVRDVSTFLRVTAIDGDGAQEIGSNGRVRKFVRHVFGDYSDVFNLDVDDTKSTPVFLLPRQPVGRTFGSLIGAPRPRMTSDGDESITHTLEETEQFIHEAEETLIKNVERAIAHDHRHALIELGKSGRVAGTGAGLKRPRLVYKSELKKAVRLLLMQNPDASSRKLCDLLDEAGLAELPVSWAKNGNREYSKAYSDKSLRANMDRFFSGVRSDLKKAGLLSD